MSRECWDVTNLTGAAAAQLLHPLAMQLLVPHHPVLQQASRSLRHRHFSTRALTVLEPVTPCEGGAVGMGAYCCCCW